MDSSSIVLHFGFSFLKHVATQSSDWLIVSLTVGWQLCTNVQTRFLVPKLTSRSSVNTLSGNMNPSAFWILTCLSIWSDWHWPLEPLWEWRIILISWCYQLASVIVFSWPGSCMDNCFHALWCLIHLPVLRACAFHVDTFPVYSCISFGCSSFSCLTVNQWIQELYLFHLAIF